MVSSDSTMQRILKWLSISETCKFLLSYLDIFEKHKCLKRKLVKGERTTALESSMVLLWVGTGYQSLPFRVC